LAKRKGKGKPGSRPKNRQEFRQIGKGRKGRPSGEISVTGIRSGFVGYAPLGGAEDIIPVLKSMTSENLESRMT